MDHARLWIKNRHDLNSLTDNEFKSIQLDLINYLGGIRGLINLALNDTRNLSYIQHLGLSSILNKDNNTNDTSSTSTLERDTTHTQQFNICSISENSLSHICTFLQTKDEFNFKCTNTVIFYSNSGMFEFTGNDGAIKYTNSFSNLHLSSIAVASAAADKKYISSNIVYNHIRDIFKTNFINQNQNQNINKIINDWCCGKIKTDLLRNTGLEYYLKNLFITNSNININININAFKLFTTLYLIKTSQFNNIFDDSLLIWFSQILSNTNNNDLISCILACIHHILIKSPYFICHIIKYKLHEIILRNILKWNKLYLINNQIFDKSLNIIIKCSKCITNDLQFKQLSLNIVIQLIKSLYKYITIGWKQHVFKGMKVRLNSASETHYIQRVITDRQYLDTDFKSKDLDTDTDNDNDNEIWIETIANSSLGRKHQIYTTNLYNKHIQYIPSGCCLSSFLSLVNILLIFKLNYSNNSCVDINLNDINIWNEIKYICDILTQILLNKRDNRYRYRRYDDKDIRINDIILTRIIAILFKIDFINPWKLQLFTDKNAQNIIKKININCLNILEIALNRDRITYKYLFECLSFDIIYFSLIKPFDNHSYSNISQLQKQLNKNEKHLKLIIILLQFISDKLRDKSQTKWSHLVLSEILKSLIYPKYSAYLMKRFLFNSNGVDIIINITQYLLTIYDSQHTYYMLSYCINLLVDILQYCNQKYNKYNNISIKCINILFNIISTDHILNEMKCSTNNNNNNHNHNNAVTSNRFSGIPPRDLFTILLSVPSTKIVIPILIYLNKKSGKVQDWYHNISLKWIVRWADEHPINSQNRINVYNLMNIIQYSSDDIKHNINYEECKIIFNIVINALPIYYNKGLSAASIRNKKQDSMQLNRMLTILKFIDKYGKPFNVFDDKFKLKLLQIYDNEYKYNDDIIDITKKMLKEQYKIDATTIDNKKYMPPITLPFNAT